MKTLKFRSYLVPLILSGEKNSTWRLFDDKELAVEDIVELKEFVTLRHFGNAKLTKVIEKSFGELTAEDKRGHEGYESDKEMYDEYTKYYKTEIRPSTKLKIIWFELIQDAVSN